ncbi:hypothetical protein [Nocardiopsis trehalosi]|uniref:hypothetical protein n=1 Tax=Nocardiopsis trehalosi TaxID=109329 RepID=UPI000834C9E4|nr:hypothetical protein [Nocardiopsis trehalosi]
MGRHRRPATPSLSVLRSELDTLATDAAAPEPVAPATWAAPTPELLDQVLYGLRHLDEPRPTRMAA